MEKQPFEQQPQPSTGHQVQPTAVLADPDVRVFAEWLDIELEKLVARWVHLAAPRAGRASLGRRSGL